MTSCRQTIWNLRIQEIQECILCHWESFTIWNAGKQGRKFYRSLTTENQRKVVAFCDVDVKKIGTSYTYEESKERPKPKVPIVHFSQVKPPLIICMKMVRQISIHYIYIMGNSENIRYLKNKIFTHAHAHEYTILC